MIAELERLTARPGQRIKPRVKEFLFWIKRQKIEAGYGILLRKTSEGTVVSANIRPPVFLGDFHVSQAEDSAFYVSRGFVNGIEPTINMVRVSGEEDKARPSIKTPEKFDENGRAWIYLEVTVGDNGRIDETDPKSVIVGADKSLFSVNKRKGRHAIAMLRDEGKDKLPLIYQIAYFSYRHAYNGKRHFFVAA